MCTHGFGNAGQSDKNTLPALKVHFFKDRFHRGTDRIFGHVRVASFNIFDDILEFPLELIVCSPQHVGNILALPY